MAEDKRSEQLHNQADQARKDSANDSEKARNLDKAADRARESEKAEEQANRAKQ